MSTPTSWSGHQDLKVVTNTFLLQHPSPTSMYPFYTPTRGLFLYKTYLHVAKSLLQFDWHSESALQPMIQSMKASLHLASQRSLWPHNEFNSIVILTSIGRKKLKLHQWNSVLVNLVDIDHWRPLEPVSVLKLILSISFPPQFWQVIFFFIS